MMVTFVSLFLWLMTQAHPVEVAVDPGVASVEIFLDGESIGVATAPGWRVQCDFGERVRPHELVAVAHDQEGLELGRAYQLVNLPRPDAEVEIVLEDGVAGAQSTLRVVAENRERLEPLAVFVTVDGVPLRRGGAGRFVLPDHDSGQVQIVGAEVHFPDGVTARADVTIGGTYGSRVTTELTAVPIVTDRRWRPKVADLQGLVRVRGEAVPVAAIEQPGARIYVVRDHETWPALRRTGYAWDRRRFGVRGRFWRRLGETGAHPETSVEIPADKDRFYLVVPNPTHSRGLALFPIIEPFEVKRFGMPWLSTHVLSPEASVTGQRLGEAVAVAGVQAVGGGCPRAVVLMLSEGAVDSGRFQPEAVREYLHALRVPLVVWSTDGGHVVTDWGPVEDVSSEGPLNKASRHLLKELGRQWIVWVEGRHLPSEIELDDRARGFRLAG
jgi:hypothetical protein